MLIEQDRQLQIINFIKKSDRIKTDYISDSFH